MNSISFVTVGNPHRTHGGLEARLAEGGITIPETSFTPDGGYGFQVLTESPAMPMAAGIDFLRQFLQRGGGLPQSSNNDAVTISPEAQAAADRLNPTS